MEGSSLHTRGALVRHCTSNQEDRQGPCSPTPPEIGSGPGDSTGPTLGLAARRPVGTQAEGCGPRDGRAARARFGPATSAFIGVGHVDKHLAHPRAAANRRPALLHSEPGTASFALYQGRSQGRRALGKSASGPSQRITVRAALEQASSGDATRRHTHKHS
jgi:hypothetical protein